MGGNFVYPKPRDWNTFEDLVCDVFARKYNNLNLQRYGRSGQRQSGVDIAGPTEFGILGIQCKHHPTGLIQEAEIDAEITLSEGFKPQLGEYVIATSAERDTKIHRFILEVSEERKRRGEYPIGIKFWDDILNWLIEYPDLLFKHITKDFPIHEAEDIKLAGQKAMNKNTLFWPFTKDDLVVRTGANIGNIWKVDPYIVGMGITDFPDVSFGGQVDMECQLTPFTSNSTTHKDSFESVVEVLSEIRFYLNDPFFSKELIVYPQVRLTHAFLIGWIFRHVIGYKLYIKARNQIWATDDLPYVPTLITDCPPIMVNKESREAVVIFNIRRDITQSVVDFVGSWPHQPFSILPSSLEGFEVKNAAHAHSLAIELSRKLKTLIDVWGMKSIHLFTAMPAALAIIIGHNLNAICPISIYAMDETRTGYFVGGTLENRL